MKELTIQNKMVTLDGITRTVNLTLPENITAVQYHSSTNKCLEEPLMNEVELSKYQNFIDEYQSIIDEENRQPTNEELAQQEIDKKIRDAQMYLANTDYKVLPDYDKTEGIEEIKALRQQARDLIRSLQN